MRENRTSDLITVTHFNDVNEVRVQTWRQQRVRQLQLYTNRRTYRDTT